LIHEGHEEHEALLFSHELHELHQNMPLANRSNFDF